MEPLTNQLTPFPHGTPCSEKKGGDSSEKGERGGGAGAPTEQIPGTQNTVHHVQYINFNDGKRGRGGRGEGGLKRTGVKRIEMLEKEGVEERKRTGSGAGAGAGGAEGTEAGEEAGAGVEAEAGAGAGAGAEEEEQEQKVQEQIRETVAE